MKFAAPLSAALLLIAGPALAQTAAPSAAPAASTEAIDPVKLDLARQLMEAGGGVKQAEAQVDGMYGAMFSKMAESMPKEQQGMMLSMQHAMQKEMHGLLAPVMDITVKLYAANFTEQELKDVLAFQRSPSGQALVRKTPAIMQQAMVQMVPMIMADMPKVMRAVVDDVCTEQHCTIEQRKTLQAAVDGAFSPNVQAAPRGKSRKARIATS